MPEFSFDALRRFPDVEAENLFASDAADRLLLDEAAPALEATVAHPGRVVVIGDDYGALTLAAAAVIGVDGIRVHQDPLSGERALDANARRLGGDSLVGRYRHLPLGRELLEGATVVLLRLPRGLAELDAQARAIAAWAEPGVVVYAAGRVKHMTIAMNEVLGRSFGTVGATLARQKSRVLVASAPREGVLPAEPECETHPEAGLTLCAVPGAFAGAKLDIGTRFLLEHLEGANPDARVAVDLGCGTGALAVRLARTRPELRVIATDQSAAAVDSTRLTASANGVELEVVRDDALSGFEPGSADLVLLNPPFHVGSTVHAGIALKLFEAAGRVLASGGELWTVFNSHLAYRAALLRAVGPTRQVARNAKFTVMASTRR
ncbi:methyltransferase [Herbiconiux moechotypicola]|uniref:Methyltransferase n=1 Tax=Herbiconiux moechotypicola TaxID=637393 RepID=A0ABP5Q3N9_9MICO|nr:class I SAM-dependent methyltransferase [Herbiconiux moechotypicola]MCS5729034.1 methyltransferase [Herbiconiux moechotypicola]